MTEFEAEMEKFCREYTHPGGDKGLPPYAAVGKAALRSKLVRDLVQELERLNDMMPGFRSVDDALEAYEKEVGE